MFATINKAVAPAEVFTEPQQKKKEVTFLGNLFFIKKFKIYLV